MTQGEMRQWGKLPKDIIAELHQRYWQNTSRFKQLLQHNSAQTATFPIIVSLKPPNSAKIVAQDTQRFQVFVKEWQNFATAYPNVKIEWKTKTLGFLNEQAIPYRVYIYDLDTLSQLLGKSAIDRLNNLHHKFSQLIALNHEPTIKKRLFDSLISYLDMIETLSDSQINKLVKVIPQLSQGLGQGNYLRAINIEGIDTKFLENHQKIIEILLAALHQSTAKCETQLENIDKTSVDNFDLLNWLGCDVKPKDWLIVRPLCEQTQMALANLPILKLSSQTLLTYELPANNILIIENETPCFMLPHLPNTIAVAGGGKNLSWLKADWLEHKKVGYWGDIDSEGLGMLSDARKKCPHIESIMMNQAIFDLYITRSVSEPVFSQAPPQFLTQDERALFDFIQQQPTDKKRLEQEFINQEKVVVALLNWLKKPRPWQ